jgi:hypothetical protein
MERVSPWLEWPDGIVRTGVAFLVATALIAVAFAYPGVLRQAGRDATHNSELSYSDREIAGGNGLVADQVAVYAARALIPENDTYKVLVDPAYAGGGADTVQFVDSYYRYFLMPRRPAEGAQWIICYGCDLAPYGSRAQVLWEGDHDVSIARISE